MGSDDDSDEVTESDAAIVVFFSFCPKFLCNFWIELSNACILLTDRVQSLFEFTFMQFRLVVVVESGELLQDITVVGLCRAHQILFFNYYSIDLKRQPYSNPSCP